MLKWQKLVLFGAVFLGVLGGFGVGEASAETYEKSDIGLNLPVQEISRQREVFQMTYGHLRPTVKQEGRKISLTLAGFAKQGEVLTAVWHEESEFSSATWHSYHHNVSSVECDREGNYHVETYLALENQLIPLDNQLVTVKSDVTVAIQSVGIASYELTIGQIPEDVISLHVPVWSQEVGLSEAVWYEAHKGKDGNYHLLLNLDNQDMDSGQIVFQIYARMANSSFTEVLGMQSLPVTESVTSQELMSQGTENTYPIGQCTWGVKQVAWWVGNNWGNAKDWLVTATRLGLTVGTEARIGAVAVWPNDGVIDGVTYGHVAYVTAVDGSRAIRVLEANYAGQQAIQDYRAWFDPTNAISGGQVYYIYPPF